MHSLVDAVFVMPLKATRAHKLQKIADLQSQIINREKKKIRKKIKEIKIKENKNKTKQKKI